MFHGANHVFSFAEWRSCQDDDEKMLVELFAYDAFCYAPEAPQRRRSRCRDAV